MPAICQQGLTRKSIPDLNSMIQASRSQISTIRRPEDRENAPSMIMIDKSMLTRLGIPDLDSAIQTGRSDLFPIGRPGQAKDHISVAGVGVPEVSQNNTTVEFLYRRDSRDSREKDLVRE